MEKRKYRVYDHRLKELIVQSGDPNLIPELNIPLSTAKEWIKNGIKEVITLPELNLSNTELLNQNMSLKNKLASTKAEQILLSTTIKIFRFQIQFTRLPSATSKPSILRAIKNALTNIPIKLCLETIGLSSARYHSWVKRDKKCQLEDNISCPKLSTTKLTVQEIRTIADMVRDSKLSHYSISALSWLGKKEKSIFASSSTWCRIVRELKLRRPRERLYPQKPKLGIRASSPCEIWHLDQSIIRLNDGTKAFIQSIIDNYSRFVLAWDVTLNYGGAVTKSLLEKSLEKSKELGIEIIPNVYVDSGTENLNKEIDSLILEGKMTRTIAQIDIEFSNSMVESLFLRLKHNYQYLKNLSNFETLKTHVDDYLIESNNKIPHNVLKGTTPLEVITNHWTSVEQDKLKEQGRVAREERILQNRSSECKTCMV